MYVPKALNTRISEDPENSEDEIYYEYDKKKGKKGYRYYFLG